MTDYKSIADRLVELGIVTSNGMGAYGVNPSEYRSGWLTAEEMCHDWRVAGVCMERMKRIDVRRTTDAGDWNVHCYGGPDKYGDVFNGKSLPLAIILAYLEATDEA